MQMAKTGEIRDLVQKKIDSGEGFEKLGNDLVAIKNFDEIFRKWNKLKK